MAEARSRTLTDTAKLALCRRRKIEVIKLVLEATGLVAKGADDAAIARDPLLRADGA
jgi:ribosomal protein L7/L12